MSLYYDKDRWYANSRTFLTKVYGSNGEAYIDHNSINDVRFDMVGQYLSLKSLKGAPTGFVSFALEPMYVYETKADGDFFYANYEHDSVKDITYTITISLPQLAVLAAIAAFLLWRRHNIKQEAENSGGEEK